MQIKQWLKQRLAFLFNSQSNCFNILQKTYFRSYNYFSNIKQSSKNQFNMPSKTDKKLPNDSNSSETDFPNIEKYFESQNQRITQNNNQTSRVIPVQTTIDSTPEKMSESQQELLDSGRLAQSRTQSHPVISEIPTNAETAFQVDESGDKKRPRRFSEPTSATGFGLQNQREIVQFPVVLNSSDLEEDNGRQNISILSPLIQISGHQNHNQGKQVPVKLNSITQEELIKSGKWQMKNLERLSVRLGPFATKSIKNSQDKRLSEKLRCFLESFGQNQDRGQDSQTTSQSMHMNSRSPLKTIQQRLGFPQNNFTRFMNFQIGDIRKTSLRNQYFQVRQTQKLYLIRGDRAKRTEGSNKFDEDQIQVSQELNKLGFTSGNFDMIKVLNEAKHFRIRNYMGADKQARLLVDEKYLRKQILQGKPFIFIQEAYCRESRAMIRRVLQTTKTKDGSFYHYPEHLELDCDLHATIILSKYKVRFGRIKFTKGNEKFAEQSFCQFQVFNLEQQRIQTFCLICCHWKSSVGQKDQTKLQELRKIRLYQKDCCDEFLKARGYYMTLQIGDTNLDVEQTLQYDQQFIDTYYQSKQENVNFAPDNQRISKYEGTQLFKRDGKVSYVRPDRILVNRAMQDRVRVKAKIDNVYLPGYEHLKKLQKQMLDQDKMFWKHIRPSDHHFLTGWIYI